jgi:hypothetical protein
MKYPSGVEYLSPKSRHAHDIINRSVFTSCEIGAARLPPIARLRGDGAVNMI